VKVPAQNPSKSFLLKIESPHGRSIFKEAGEDAEVAASELESGGADGLTSTFDLVRS